MGTGMREKGPEAGDMISLRIKKGVVSHGE